MKILGTIHICDPVSENCDLLFSKTNYHVKNLGLKIKYNLISLIFHFNKPFLSIHLQIHPLTHGKVREGGN